MTEPEDIVINSYTAANNPVSETLIKASIEDLLHVEAKQGILNLSPGCILLQAPAIDIDNMTLTIHLGYTEFEKECPFCSNGNTYIKEWGERTIKDVHLGAFKVILKVKIPRIVCPKCGRTKWLNPAFKHPFHRITMRLYSEIVQLLDLGVSHIDLSKIAEIVGVEADIVRDLDKARLKELFKDIPLNNVRYIAIDEISIKKHHNYVSVIIDAQTRRLLYACYGRKKDDLRPFFERLEELGLIDNIKGAVMDGNCGYQNLVKELCPNAKIVLDLFHCIQQYNHEVADSVRQELVAKLKNELREMSTKDYVKNKDKYNELISDLKKSKWLSYIGRNRLETVDEAHSAIRDIIEKNEPLLQVEIFSDNIRDLWHKGGTPENVKTAIENFCKEAEQTGIRQIVAFGKKLKNWTEYIVHAATTGLNTSILEGCNNKFKVIKRVAYGFRDIEYFILKLHQSLSVDRQSTLKPYIIC